MICLSCTEKTIDANLKLIRKNLKFIDLVEIRVDFLEPSEWPGLKTMPEKIGLPCILTYRWPKDGGANNGADVDTERRSEILNESLVGGWTYIDLEDDADSASERQLIKTAETAGTRVIKSFHDFDGVPDKLAERMFDNSCGDRFIPKAAVMPKSTVDLFKIIDAYRRLEDIKIESNGYSCTNGPMLSDYILVGMGSYGFPTRIMAGVYGSMLTFCSDGENLAAPGHVSPRELVEIYNYHNLGSDTAVYGIIGNPVMHTKSPLLHNRTLREKKIDGVYLPFETAEPELLLANAEKLKLHGLSVTIPHKQRVLGLADWVDEAAVAIGACNTLVHRGERWKGYNTDWKGFLAPLDNALGAGALEGRTALVIGAGGAARAVVYALVNRGMKVLIVNRTVEKAGALADEFGCRSAGLDAVGFDDGFFIVVQTTSAGMEPDIDGNPVPGFDFSGTEIAYDLIYAPEKTRFLREAEAAGCRIFNGLPMLQAQAEEQFKLFYSF